MRHYSTIPVTFQKELVGKIGGLDSHVGTSALPILPGTYELNVQ